MKKGAISLVGSMLMLLGGVSGCGGSTTSEKDIVFWHCIGHDKMRNFTRIVDKFNEEHAKTDGYRIVPEKLAGAYDDLHDAVKTKLQAGSVPSITMGYPDSFAEYIGSKGEKNSQILKLDNFITEDKSFNKDEFVPGYYNEGTGYQYSGTWSMPLYKSTEAMYVNKQMFEGTTFYKTHKDETYGNYGAKIGDPATWDWDTLVYVAKECQKELGSKPDFHALGYDSDANLFISQMAMRNIPYTTAEGTGSQHFLFCDNKGEPNADVVKFAAEVLDFTETGALVTQGSYGSFASDLFLTKKAMITIGSTGGSSYNDPHGSTEANFDCSLYPVPSFGGKSNAKYIMQGPSLCFFNTKNEKKEKVAWEFYSKFVSDAELNAALALENSYDPVKVSSYNTDIYKEFTGMGKTSEGDDDVTKQLQFRIPNLTATIKDDYITSSVFNGSAKARSEIGAILKYAKTQDTKLNSSQKVTLAIKKIFVNCVNYIRGTGK